MTSDQQLETTQKPLEGLFALGGKNPKGGRPNSWCEGDGLTRHNAKTMWNTFAEANGLSITPSKAAQETVLLVTIVDCEGSGDHD